MLPAHSTAVEEHIGLLWIPMSAPRKICTAAVLQLMVLFMAERFSGAGIEGKGWQ